MSDGQQRKRKVEVEYKVLRPFKYNGQQLQPGDEFIPAGSPNDAKLINQGKFVRRVETVQQDAEAARRPSKAQRSEAAQRQQAQEVAYG
jgi:hypothetical protein